MTPLMLAILRVLVSGWYLMLGIGIVHAEVLHSIRPVGYGTSLLLAITLGGFIEIVARAAIDRALELHGK